MRNTGLEQAQVGIKIAGRNNNLRYADDTTLMAESEEELKKKTIISMYRKRHEKWKSLSPKKKYRTRNDIIQMHGMTSWRDQF